MIDPNDKTWAAVKAFAQGEIKTSVSALKAKHIDYTEVMFHRGRVAALEELLWLAPVETDTGEQLPQAATLAY